MHKILKERWLLPTSLTSRFCSCFVGWGFFVVFFFVLFCCGLFVCFGLGNIWEQILFHSGWLLFSSPAFKYFDQKCVCKMVSFSTKFWANHKYEQKKKKQNLFSDYEFEASVWMELIGEWRKGNWDQRRMLKLNEGSISHHTWGFVVASYEFA